MTVGTGVPDTSPERVRKNADDGNDDDDEKKVDHYWPVGTNRQVLHIT